MALRDKVSMFIPFFASRYLTSFVYSDTFGLLEKQYESDDASVNQSAPPSWTTQEKKTMANFHPSSMHHGGMLTFLIYSNVDFALIDPDILNQWMGCLRCKRKICCQWWTNCLHLYPRISMWSSSLLHWYKKIHQNTIFMYESRFCAQLFHVLLSCWQSLFSFRCSCVLANWRYMISYRVAASQLNLSSKFGHPIKISYLSRSRLWHSNWELREPPRRA